MRFLTYKYGEKTFLGVLTEDGACLLYTSLPDFLQDLSEAQGLPES